MTIKYHKHLLTIIQYKTTNVNPGPSVCKLLPIPFPCQITSPDLSHMSNSNTKLKNILCLNLSIRI